MDEQKIKGTLGALSLFLIVATVYVGAAAFNKFEEIGWTKDRGTRATISVSGEADVFAKPDLAVVMISTVNEAKTVENALIVNTGNMNSIIKFVKEQGVEEKDLKTANFSISPRYEYEQKGAADYYLSGKRVLAGYEVRQSLEVKIRDMSKIGILIEGASGDGANEIGDLQFTIEKQDELKAQARKEAIAEVKAKAKGLSSQMGVKLGRIVGFSESGDDKMAESGLRAGMGGATPDIAVGENKITSSVTITYEIK